MIFVAEIGSLHKGSESLLWEIIRQAAEAGADIVKLQFGWPSDDPVRYVSPELARAAESACIFYNVELMASIWSPAGLELAQSVSMQRYKIAAQKADDAALVRAVLADGRETFISGKGWYPSEQIRPIFCMSKYPTYPRDFLMPDHFRDWYGYSDHCHGIAACLLAVARGARYVEKHFCLDKTDLVTRDTPFSATPKELAELVRLGRGVRRLLDAALVSAG